jgi:hypothetical protein
MQAPRRRGGAVWRTARAVTRWADRPPLDTRFKKGRSGNPGGPQHQEAAGNAGRCAERDGRRDDRRRAPHDQQARGDRHADGRQIGECTGATKMLIDMMKDVEHKVGDAAPSPEPRRLAAADKEVVQLFVARLRRQILQEIEEAKAAESPR